MTSTDRRIYAHQYVEAEIKAMPAGPLLDWLAWQGIIELYHDEDGHGFLDDSRVLFDMRWDNEADSPVHCYESPLEISTDPGAALRALKAKGDFAELHHNPCLGAWVCKLSIDKDNMEIVHVAADTPELAIARALALYARAKQIAEKEEA